MIPLPPAGPPTGRLSGIGVGPGDPELLTLKAVRRITEAAVIAYPMSDDTNSLARSIAAAHIRPDHREVPMPIPCGQARAAAGAAYDAIAGTLAASLDGGEGVAVLCEGDPFLYGSFMYLFARLSGRYAVEVVPGVSSLTAVAATAATPLCSLNDVLTVLPAPLPDEALAPRLAQADTIALVKVHRHFARIRALIAAAGLTAQARYVERASLPGQRVLPLDDVDPATVPYFSMILINRAPVTAGAS